MATQISEHSADTVAHAFVDQYYRILHMLIDQSYRFYKDESVLSWAQPDGELKSATTTDGIAEFIKSSHFKDSKVEVATIDSQVSAAGGFLVVVTATLIGQDESRKSFSQTFFLAPQEKGYFVLNDIFRFVGVVESSTVVTYKDDENASVASLEPATEDKVEENVKAIESKVDENVNEVSEKSEAKVTTDDEVENKPSVTSNETEQPVVETTSSVETGAPKVTYASMMMMGRSAPPTNAPHRVVRVAANADIQPAPKKPQANGVLKALASNSNGMPIAQEHNNYSNEEIECKSVYIGGLPTNTTSSELYSIVKQFGPVHSRDVQLKTYEEDGYCCGFVHFQDDVSARNAVQTHHIIVRGREAYIRFKRIKGRGERGNSPSGRGGFRDGYDSRSRPQSSEGRKGEGYQQNYRRRD
ncbi:nuclear transport factor 2-like [Nicotiana sylvestris]|uniref:G3BP-like protein n=1 Tax=Nicotiana sylvestris TaxID=4096 RepID=A0A1U7YLQ0_NICSY|nr:PREDICTED: putative G3BP-like protein [Nicotiana sylvestris]